MSNDLTKIFIDHIPVLYHWLDGFISADFGNSIESTNRFIINKMDKIIESKSIILSRLLVNGLFIPEIELYNCKTKQFKLLKFRCETEQIVIEHQIDTKTDSKSSSKPVYTNTHNYSKISDKLDELQDIFKFNIFQTGDELHAICLVTFIKNNIMYLHIINSGEGIETNEFIQVNNKNYYTPSESYILCDDVSDKIKLENGFNTIISICYFGYIYKELNDMVKQSKQSKIMVDDKFVYEINDKVICLLKFIVLNSENIGKIVFGKHTLKSLSELQKDTTVYISRDNMWVQNENYYTAAYIEKMKIYYMNKKDGDPAANKYHANKYNDFVIEKQFSNIINKSDIGIFNELFYAMLCKFVPNKTNFTLEANITEHMSLVNTNQISNGIAVNPLVLEKMLFKVSNGKLFIEPQESGSCTWYSVYWSLLMYEIYYLNNVESYIDLIKQINIQFSQYVFDIFYRFPDECFTSVFLMWKKLFVKLCDIGLLDNNKFFNIVDYMYQTPFSFSPTIKKWKDAIEYVPITFKNLNISKYSFVNNSIIGDIIKNIPNNKQELNKILINGILKIFEYGGSNGIQRNGLSDQILMTNTLILFYFNIYKLSKKDNIQLINKEFNSVDAIKFLTDKEIAEIISEYMPNDYLDKIERLFRILEKTFSPETDSYTYQFFHIATFLLESTDDTNEIILLSTFLSRGYIISLCMIYIQQFISSISPKNTRPKPTDKKPLNGNRIQDVIIVCNKLISLIVGIDSDYINTNVRESTKLFERSFEQLSIISNYLKKYSINNFTEPDCFVNANIIRTYESFDKTKQFFYDNPEYIYKNSESDEIINEDSFIRIHIHDILKPKNLKYRENFIRFYGKKFSQIIKSNTTHYNEIILFNLHLLMYGIELYIPGGNQIQLLNFTTGNTNYREFYDLIHNIYKQDVENFDEYLVNNYQTVSRDILEIIKSRLIKYYPNTQIDKKLPSLEQKLFINDDEYVQLVEQPRFCIFFNIKSTDIILYSDSKDLKKFIILTDKYIFKIEGNIIDFKLQIKNIYVNGNKCIKFSQINYPFKYAIPLTCNHLVFQSDNLYKVLYICTPEEIIEGFHPLVNSNDINNFVEFIINENNMLFPKITEPNTWQTFIKICNTYHVRPLNLLFTKIDSHSGYCVNEKLYELFGFNKNKFLIMPIEQFSTNTINLMTPVVNNKGIITIDNNSVGLSKVKNLIGISDDKIFDSLISKIENCRVVEENKAKTLEYLQCLQNQAQREIFSLMNYYSTVNISQLFKQIHGNYLVKIKIVNIVNTLIKQIANEDGFCSQIKILRELYKSRTHNFKYNFELVFETVSGNELLQEQQTRYFSIMDNYTGITYTPEKRAVTGNETSIIEFNQTGGSIYPLHHLMMGKGKSSVMSPLLTAYFSLIHNKNIYIIVPEHLVADTKYLINQYGHIFNIEDKIKIKSDSEIKYNFLNGDFTNGITNTNSIFIIDEFDSLLDPAKSNFNIVENKKISITPIFKVINQIIKLMEQKPLEDIEIKEIKLEPDISLSTSAIANIITEIKKIYKTIKSDTFVENIHWGVDTEKYYVVPYVNKDKPIPKSTFSSSVLTVFLTVYYYRIYKRPGLSPLVIKFIVENNMWETIFKVKQPTSGMVKFVEKYIKSDPKVVDTIFEIFLVDIFKTFLLPEEQFNTSFVDILNIDGIYKIGYSGTVNVDLPAFPRESDKFLDIYGDSDELINVAYSILNGNIWTIGSAESLELSGANVVQKIIDILKAKSVNLSDYDAFIDQLGIFKNVSNEDVAHIFNKTFSGTREIIYMSESDEKLVLINGEKISYNSSVKYTYPFIYYSQGHVIGVDIKQDYLPKMKGLCTINGKSKYTNVAQAVFRLRKLNLGHTVDIVFIDKEQSNSNLSNSHIYNLLKENDRQQRLNKADLLAYQTIKSEIRKARIQNGEFKNNYKEKIKYYYIDGVLTNLYNCLEGILTPEELDNPKLSSLLLQINKPDKLEKLVYNIDSELSETVKSLEIEKVKSVTHNINVVINEHKRLKLPKLYFEYFKYDFADLGLKKIFDNLTIPIDEVVSFVPNIIYQGNNNGFYKNKSGIVFVLFETIARVLIIPGHMAPEFAETNVLLSVNNFSLINFSQLEKYNANKELIKCLSKTMILNFILSGKIFHNITEPKITTILAIILCQFEKILAEHSTLLARYKNFNNTSDFSTYVHNSIGNFYEAFVWCGEKGESHSTSSIPFHPQQNQLDKAGGGKNRRYLISY